jgi:hypothetical protein
MLRLVSATNNPMVDEDRCEAQALTICPVKHDKVSSLRVKNSPASDDEWQSILGSVLSQEPLPDIQASATVESESSISITIRKQIQGITVRHIGFDHEVYRAHFT